MANKKEQGTMDEALNQSEAFFLKYKKAIIGVVVAIVVIVAGSILYYNYVFKPEQEEASTQLARGEQYMQMGDLDKALKGDGANYKGFISIASNYSSTDAGNLANLYAGLCYAHLQKPDWKNALKYVKEFDTSDDMIISPASQMALGDIYANNNQLDDAVKSFKKAADMADDEAADNTSNSVAPLALRKAGVILEKQGKKDEANKLYTDIKKKYVKSAVYQDIDKYIERTAK
jgi:TolA-binding protein